MYLFLHLCKYFYSITEQQLKLFDFQVRQKREALNFDRESIADRLDIQSRTYAKWENGQSEPPLGKALEIAEILNTTLYELLGQNSAPANSSFNNNSQEGENNVMHNQIGTFDRATMQEINHRFAFLEEMLKMEREEKKSLIDLLKISKY
jgi:transcriptional regulator with XRE-family HTH domain